MPFITEEIYHLLKERNDDLVVKQFSPIEKSNREVLIFGNKLKEVISAVRDAKAKNKLKPKEPISLYIETNNESSYQSIKEILSKQVHADHILFNQKPASSSIMIVAGDEKIHIQSDAEIDTGAQKEKLMKDLNYLKGFLLTVDKKLSNEKFVQNAKQEIIELERKKKQDAETRIKVIEQTLSAL